MVINLDKPFSLGDLSPIQFPHIYISRMIIDGRSALVSVQYEVGVMSAQNVWTPTPISTVDVRNIQGSDLYPFYFSKPTNDTDSLWDQVEILVYTELQKLVPRLSGKIGPPVSPLDTTETTPGATETTQSPESQGASDSVPDANV